MMFTEQNVELSTNHPIWCESATLSTVWGGWHAEGLACVRGGDAGLKAAGVSGEAEPGPPEQTGTLLPRPHSTTQAVGRKGVLACTVPGQAPVPQPERWKGGELRSYPRLPNPESEAFICSVLT